jgi:hypothetical protein
MLKSFNFPGIVTPTNLGGNEEVNTFFCVISFSGLGENGREE